MGRHGWSTMQDVKATGLAHDVTAFNSLIGGQGRSRREQEMVEQVQKQS